MFAEEVVLADFLKAGAVFVLFLALAWIFYYIISQILRRLFMKTGIVLDDLMIRAVKWPVFTGIVLAGIYLASIILPFETKYDFEVSRGVHLALIILAAWAVSAVIDALFHWFKLEVTSKTNTPVDDWITTFVRVITPVILVEAMSAEMFFISLYEEY